MGMFGFSKNSDVVTQIGFWYQDKNAEWDDEDCESWRIGEHYTIETALLELAKTLGVEIVIKE